MINIREFKEQKSILELLEFGIINFDKPADCTSFDVVDFVKKRLKLRKTSHFGTLDPMVTGILPIALNRAVKLTGFFIGEDKEYEGVMNIHKDIPIEEIKKIIVEKFIGKIIQLPPVKSRVKRQEREREIKQFEILKKNGREVSFIVECEGGTYIRKLIHDLGEALGIGAHMTKLRRIRAGIFLEKKNITRKNENPLTSESLTSHTKEEFEKAVEEYEKGNENLLKDLIIPAEIVSEVYPVVEIKKNNLKQIFTGKPIHKKDLVKLEKIQKGKIICVFSNCKFVGMYKVINEGEIYAKAEFVLQSIR